MTIASEITRIKTAIADAYTACQGMGATMPAVMDSDHLDACIQSISGGQPTPSTKQRLVSVADNLDTNKLVLYTDDGINWNTATMPNSRNWGNVFYGNGKFIVPCYGSNIFAYSTDGINWTEGTLPASNNWLYGAYGNGIYVLMADDGYGCTSVDGINWSNYTYIVATTGICGLIFDGTQFVFVARASDNNVVNCFVSSDFQTFSTRSGMGDFMMTYGLGKGVLGYDGSRYYLAWADAQTADTNMQKFYISTDLVNWTELLLGSVYTNVYPITSCSINGSIKIFGGKSSLSIQSAGYINIDSAGTTTFVGSSVPRLNYQGGANIINGKAIVIGYGSDQYIYSTDGTTWTTGTLPASSGWWGSCVGEVAI